MKLRLDDLETRTVPSTLIVPGTANADEVLIRDHGAEGVEVVREGKTTKYTDIDRVEVHLRGGADILRIQHVGTDTDRSRDYHVEMGAHDDQVFVTFPGGLGTKSSEDGLTSYHLGGGLGNDKFFVSMGSLRQGNLSLADELHLTVESGAGDDEATFDAQNVQFNAPVRGEFRLGAGDDTGIARLNALGHAYNGAWVFLTDGGIDDVQVTGNNLLFARGGGVRADTGQGADEFVGAFKDVAIYETEVNFLSADVDVDGIEVNSGAGNDMIDLLSQNVQFFGTHNRLDAGPGDDSVSSRKLEVGHNYDGASTYLLGTGNDQFRLFSDGTTYEHGDLTINYGAGNDSGITEIGNGAHNYESSEIFLGGEGNERFTLTQENVTFLRGHTTMDFGAGNTTAIATIRNGAHNYDGFVNMLGHGGIDRFRINLEDMNFASGGVLVDTGGNNDFLIANSDNVGHNYDGEVSYIMRGGDDFGLINAMHSLDRALNLNVHLGEGNDIGGLATELALGASQTRATQLSRGMNVAFLGGAGTDIMLMNSVVSASGDLVVPFQLSIDIDGGADGDALALRNAYRGNRSAITGELMVEVHGRGGNDFFLVQLANMQGVKLSALLDGGDGFDSAIVSDNVVTRNIEWQPGDGGTDG
ncbi:MAG: hypothetical protein L0241_16085 [Planctomycetia bacterium]|nr:hypothetical protein [Planctomycetia bacterium]